MTFTWERDAGRLAAGGRAFRVTCAVRNELNGLRLLHDPSQVTRHTPPRGGGARQPVMPRPFPLGEWRVTAVYETGSPDYKPVVFETDARQILPVWALDRRGGYDRATGDTVEDWGYWLHCAWLNGRRSGTTHGCGNIVEEGAAMELRRLIKAGDVLEVV
jgi:hypothetical protein